MDSGGKHNGYKRSTASHCHILFEWLTIGTFGAINGGHYFPCGVSPKGWLAAPSKMSISWLDLPRLPTAFIMSQHPTIKEVLPVIPIFPTGNSEW
jgi:hypothetical protein